MEVKVELTDGEVLVFNFPSKEEVEAERAEFDKVFGALFSEFNEIIQTKDES